MNKRIVSLLLAVVMVLGLAPMTVLAAEDVTEIGSVEDLLAFAAEVNGGNTTLDAVLTADIDLTGTVWYSTDDMTNNQIGTLENPYAGTFDGNGYTVSGMDIYAKNDTKVNDVEIYKSEYVTGFFGATDGATIQNLTVAGTAEYIGQGEVVDGVTTGRHGGVIGKAVNTTVTNVTSEVDHGGYGYWYYAGANYGPQNIGGIIGWGQAVTLDMCANKGDIQLYNTKYVAGIIGFVAAAETPSSFNRCVNHGDILATDCYGGGFGFIEGTTGSEPDTITNSYVTGDVCGRNWNRQTDVYASQFSGGILMCGFTAGANVKVIDCFAVGQCGDDGKVYADDGSLPVCASGIYMKGYNDGVADQFENVHYYVGNVNISYSNPALEPGLSRWSSWEYMANPAFLAAMGDAFFLPEGAEYPMLKWECEHTIGAEGNGDGTHTVTGICATCGFDTGVAYDEACADNDADFLCDVCGAYVASDNWFEIADADDLLTFSKVVALGGTAVNARLTADIDLTGTTWYSNANSINNQIGSVAAPYAGTFDGQGYTISGLDISVENTGNPTEEYATGLFSATDGATIKNVTIAGTAYYMGQTEAEYGRHGGLIGKAVNTALISCISEVDASGYGYWYYSPFGPEKIGGLVGYGQAVTMDMCANYGDILLYNSRYIAGLVGYVASAATPSTFYRCVNTGDLMGSQYLGGLVGYIEGTTGTEPDTIDSCYNTGDIACRTWNRTSDVYAGNMHGGSLMNGFAAGANVMAKNSFTVGESYDDGKLYLDDGVTPYVSVTGIAHQGYNDGVNQFENVHYYYGNVNISYSNPSIDPGINRQSVWTAFATDTFLAKMGDNFFLPEGAEFPILKWECDHDWSGSTYVAVSYQVHKGTEQCSICGMLGDVITESEACVDENGDGLCDLCSASMNCPHEADQEITYTANNDGTHTVVAVCSFCDGYVLVEDTAEKEVITMDFKAFAREAATQDWWNELAKTDANTRYIGRAGNTAAPTAAQLAAYAEMREYLAEHEAWNIDEDLSNFTNWWKRAHFNASPDVPWGISYWCYYHGNSGTPERAKLAFTVTAQESGWYAMKLDAFRSITGYSTESMTIGSSGGGFADVFVNGQKVCDEYSFSGRSYANTATYYGAVNNVAKVWLNEGENSVYLNSTHAFDSEATVISGRCNINLNSMTFEPLGGETMKAGSSRVLDLRASYLGFTDEVSGDAESSDTDVVEAALDGSMVTLTAIGAGEAEVTVGDIVIPVTVEETYGESYDFSHADYQMTGDSASKEFTIEVSEDGWYEPQLRFVRQNVGGKVSVYVDDHYLGTVNTYDSDSKIADFARLRGVELTQGEHTLRLTVTGKDNGMGSATAKVQWLGLDLIPAEEPELRLVCGSISEKRLRTAEVPLIVRGMANSAVGAQWEVEVSDEAVLTAEVIPATLTSEAKLQVVGLEASDDAWVTVTANIGGMVDTVTVPVQILPTAGLQSAAVSVKGVDTGVVARSTVQSFAFDMMGDDGEALTAEEVEISYAVSQTGIIEIDETAHTFETLANGEVTVTVTISQNETAFTEQIALTVADLGENELAADASSFDNASKWDGMIAPSDSQWLSSEIVDDGTGNMVLKLEHNPNVTQNQSKSPAYVPKNGNLATMELGHLYEMHFRFKYEGYKRAEGAKYDPRISVQIYDYYGNGFGVGGLCNKLYTGSILPFFNYEEGQWYDMVVYARGPADGEGSVFGMPRITYNCHYAAPTDRDLTGWEGTFWFDDIEVREVGFDTMEVVADGELRADKTTATVTARPVSTTGNYITLDKGTLKESIAFESGNTDVIEVTSAPTIIEDKVTGIELTREAATAKVQLVGKNDTGSVIATATVGRITRSGALEITATNMPEVIRDIRLTLNDVDSLVLPHGGTAESGVTGRTTELAPLQWEDFDKLYFTSSDLSVATVEPYTGKVTCVGEGTATITAYALLGSKTVKDTALITVTDDTDLASITITAPKTQIPEQNTLFFTAEGKKSSGVKADMNLYPVAWSVDDEMLATITADGMLTALQAGTVTVKASIGVEDKVVEATMVITVAANEEQPANIVEFKFYNEGAPKLETATLEKDGIEIDRELTYKGLEGNTWHKGGFRFPVPVGGELVMDFMIKRSGWYRVEASGYSLYYVGCLTSFYVDDYYIGSPDFGADTASNYDAGGIYNTIWLDAGKHTMRYKAEEARSITAGKVAFYPVADPNAVSLDAQAAKNTLVAGEQTTLELEMVDVNKNPWFLHYETTKPDYTNYYTAVSSDPSVVSVTRDLFTTYLNALKPGTATITVTAEILGETLVREIPVTVEEGTIVSAELDAEFTTHRPGAAAFPLTVKATGLEGELAALPEGTTITYESADSEIAAVSQDGMVTPGSKEGSTLITAVLTEGSHVMEMEIWITITSGKSEPTVFTYEERANAQENVLKYNWAWQEKEAAVKLADYYVENIDALYEAFMHEGIPKNSRLTLLGDTDYAICPGCGTDLVAAGYGTAYHYLVDPIENPWKVTCPHCKMDFPSNDFESFYKLGLDETGHFTIDRAMANGGEKYLVNELYPERGEDWGVDNGWGWFPGEYAVDGNERAYLFIGYYVTFNLYTVSGSSGPHGATSVFDALREAYIFTGDEKYGNAGAILIDRYADIYPGHDLSHWSKHRTWYSGNAGNFGKVTDLIWESILIQCLAKAVDAFWPCADNPEVVEYLRGKASLKGLNPEDITPDQIRQNAENGILREAIKSFYSGKAWGNFGLPQAGAALTAVCLDTNPETEELINWIFLASDKGGTTSNGWNTGGDVNRVLVEEVDREGFGNEGSLSYNYIWLTNLLDCADALNGYDKVEAANLWEHPKFLNMYRAYMQLTCCGRLCYDLHETPGAFQALPALVQPEVLMPAFIATGDPEIAQAIYSRNGNSVAGLHADIYTKDPESGIRTKIQQIVNEYGQWDMSESMLLSGYGLAALKSGPSNYIAGSNENEFFDFWIGFGRTDTHTHFEAMNMELSAFGLPLNGNMGYPQVMSGDSYNRLQWIQHTTSNNTVVVDDSCQVYNSESGIPLHFEDADKVKIMDVDSPASYEQTDIYRRTVVTVQGDNGIDYGVDFFRILGGSEHVYSFHGATRIDPTVEGLEMVKQPMGTYAGADIPFGDYDFNDETGAAINTGSGYNWLWDVYRDETPGTKFTVDWAIEDYQHQLATSAGIHMRLTMLSEEPLAEVALANGQPAQDGRAPDHVEFMLVRNSGSEGLDTLFTSVIEPYQAEMQVIDAELVKMEPVDGEAVLNERYIAVKTTLNTGRVDYIVYTTNPERTYSIDNGKFTFRGFTGVASYRDDMLVYSYGCEATSLCDSKLGETLDGALGAVTGQILSFTGELAENYTMTVSANEACPAEDLAGRYIYVNNDRHQNGVYEILGAVRNADGTVTLDMGHQDFIRGYVDEFNMELGYIYNIAEGQTFSIPLSADFDAMEFFNYQTDTVVKAGNKLTLATGNSGMGVTYAADGLVGGMKLDAKTGTLTWTTSRTQTGRYPVTIKAVDAEGTVLGEMSFVIYVVSYTGSAYDASVCSHAKAVTYNVDGIIETVCPACGTITKTELTEKFDVAGSNMTLGNELRMNYLVKTSDLGSGTYTAKITHNGEVAEKTFAKYNSTYHYVSYTVAAAQMADEITVEVFDENGNAVSNVYTTSVRTYAMNLLGRSTTNAKTKTLLVDMLNYGAAAQENFGYNTSDLANAKLTAAQKALATAAVTCTDGRVKGENYYGSSLSLEEKILLNVYFKNVASTMYAEISFTAFDGTKKTVEVPFAEFKQLSGSTYAVVVDDIVLAEAFNLVTVTVYNADGTVHGTATDSVESYIARSAKSELNEAIMKFAASAKVYYS